MKSNKKILIFTLIIFFGTFLSGYLVKYYLEKSTDKLLTKISSVEKSILNENWEKAYRDIKLLNKEWEEVEKYWALMTNHHEIDNISIALKTSIEYIKNKDEIETSSSLAQLRHFIGHIPERESLSLKNIF